MDHRPPGSSIHGIFQAGIPDWVAMPFSMRSSQLRHRICVPWIAGSFFTTDWGFLDDCKKLKSHSWVYTQLSHSKSQHRGYNRLKTVWHSAQFARTAPAHQQTSPGSCSNSSSSDNSPHKGRDCCQWECEHLEGIEAGETLALPLTRVEAAIANTCISAHTWMKLN